MSAPLPVELAALSALAPPCPACGVPLLLDEKHTTTCHACRAVVGAPARFVDEKQKKKPLRPVFSTGPVRACCRCRQTTQRVLVDDVCASFCAGCNLVVVAKGQAPRLLNPINPDRLSVQTERPRRRGLRRRDWAAVALLLVVVGVVAAVEMQLL